MIRNMKIRGWVSLALTVGLLFTAGAAGSAAASAQGWRDRDRYERDRWDGRWTYLGEANVDGRVDHDRIRVGRDDGRFHALQLRVERGPIEFHRVVVHYAGGGEEVLHIRDWVPAGGQTRAIDLRGRSRAISSVEFWYARGSRRSAEPKVRLFGR
jgi:hypothetical protein